VACGAYSASVNDDKADEGMRGEHKVDFTAVIKHLMRRKVSWNVEDATHF
jgi:hypothetical protein